MKNNFKVPSETNHIFDLDRLKVSHNLCLNWEFDNILQEIVNEASTETAFPIALVSIVLKNIQFFKAAKGLPAELEISKATDRCSSFCQFVVQTGEPVMIENTDNYPDLPQSLIESYHIRSYFGMPITVNNQIVGSLCVIDAKPRDITEGQKNYLKTLATRVSERLHILHEDMRKNTELVKKVTAPTFGEIRNLLAATNLNSELVDAHVMDSKPLMRLLENLLIGQISDEDFKRNFMVLSEALVSAKEVVRIQEKQKKLSALLSETVLAFEKALIENHDETIDIVAAIQAAATVSLHQTRVVGGVKWLDLPLTPVPASINQQSFILLVSFTLNLIVDLMEQSKKAYKGIQIQFEQKLDSIVFNFHCKNLTQDQWEHIGKMISIFAHFQKEIEIKPQTESIEFILPAIAATQKAS